MRELEARYAQELVIIGVHSGKYTAERETPRVREAANRLEIDHPIVNDRQFRTWRAYAVRAWPTVVVIDPRGMVLGTHAGEFTADMLAPVLDRTIAESDRGGHLVRSVLPHHADSPMHVPGVLRYPGKVARDGRRFAIADSGHHRVLIGELDAEGHCLRVTRVVGGGARGYADGINARFDEPQGLVFDGDRLHVADAGNHVVRAISLGTGDVRTVAGTGRQLRTRADRQAGALSSPWDLALVGRTLLIAMAGTHQLFTLDLETGAVRIHAGSGREDLADGPHNDAALAQPMGLAATGEGVYFADAESSAIRFADLDAAGAVGTVVGTGLFDFGDQDGIGDEVRLQHPQALAVHPSGRLLVADSYNDSLKWIEPATRRCETWIGGLHEPAGIAAGDGCVYVADTNAHRVAVVSAQSGNVESLELVL